MKPELVISLEKVRDGYITDVNQVRGILKRGKQTLDTFGTDTFRELYFEAQERFTEGFVETTNEEAPEKVA